MKVSKVIPSDEEIALEERGKRNWDKAGKDEREAIDRDIEAKRAKRQEDAAKNQDAYDRFIGVKAGPARKNKTRKVIE